MPIEPLRCSYCGAPLRDFKCAYCGTLHAKVENTYKVMKTCFKHSNRVVFYTDVVCPKCVQEIDNRLAYEKKLRERNEKEQKERERQYPLLLEMEHKKQEEYRKQKGYSYKEYHETDIRFYTKHIAIVLGISCLIGALLLATKILKVT